MKFSKIKDKGSLRKRSVEKVLFLLKSSSCTSHSVRLFWFVHVRNIEKS